jgi:molybdenum cofactor cytidylyltransferase
MSRDKLLLPYGKWTVVEEVLSQISRTGLEDIMVITGYENDKIEDLTKKKFKDRFRIVYNRNYNLGRSESIKRAVENISDSSDALLFMVGDKPTVKCDLINGAIDKFRERSPLILYILTPAGRGIIFSRELFPELLQLVGDIGSAELIGGHMKDVWELEDDEIQVDIDTEADYRGLDQ